MTLLDAAGVPVPVQGESMLPEYLGRIKQRVDAHMPLFQSLHYRMRGDQALYDNEPYDNITRREGSPLVRKRYHRYISSDPQTFADKIISTISMSSRTVKVEQMRESDQKRELNQMAVDFTNTALRMADELQLTRGEPDIVSQIAYDIALRGWYAVRALIHMDPATGQTVFDVTPFDPHNVICGWNANGLEWVCNISWQTYSELRQNHPTMQQFPPSPEMATESVRVYDYYDSQMNVVFTENMEIKAITPHGSPRIPVVIGHVGGRTRSSVTLVADDYTDGYVRLGDSVFKRVREMYREYNHKMTMLGDLIERTADPSWDINSINGSKALKDNPTEGGHFYQTQIGETIRAVEMPSLDGMASEYFERISREIQRATLPITAYGETPSGASGFLFQQTTRQQYVGTLDPFIKGMDNCFQQITELLRAQYAMGYFPPINIPGTNDPYVPQALQVADRVMITHKPGIPRDWQTLASTAQILRAPGPDGRPGVPLDFIWQYIYEIDDIEGFEDLINIEMAEQRMPEVAFYRIFESALKREDHVLARQAMWRYFNAMIVFQAEQSMMLAQLAEAAAASPAARSGGGSPNSSGSPQPRAGVQPPPAVSGRGSVLGVGANIASQQALGGAQPPPIQQGGPLVSPGSPRPGGSNRRIAA